MTITEFIAKLEQLRAEHGDLPVAVDRTSGIRAAVPEIDEASRHDHGDYPVGQKVVLI